jgi:sulfite exporter TauE/SafE
MEDVTSISGHATQNAVYAVCGVFTVFMGLMVIARMGTRMFIAKQTGLDDAFIVAAAVFSLMYCIMTYNQAEQGMGLHVWDPSIDTVTMSIFFWGALWSYYAALGFTKLSILLQYLRIFPQKTFRKACYGLIGVTVLWTLWAVFSSMVMCVPIHAFWTTSDFFHDPRCLPRLEMWCVTNPEPSMRRC